MINVLFLLSWLAGTVIGALELATHHKSEVAKGVLMLIEFGTLMLVTMLWWKLMSIDWKKVYEEIKSDLFNPLMEFLVVPSVKTTVAIIVGLFATYIDIRHHGHYRLDEMDAVIAIGCAVYFIKKEVIPHYEKVNRKFQEDYKTKHFHDWRVEDLQARRELRELTKAMSVRIRRPKEVT